MFRVIDLESGQFWEVEGTPSSFESGSVAATWAAALTESHGRKFQVRRIESAADSTWQARESARFTAGVYTVPAWFAEAGLNPFPEHFLHVSRKNPALLAFTQSSDKGARDIQTPIKVGVYLSTYFGLDAAACARYSAMHASLYAPKSFNIAVSADEIERVYTFGPRSCMGGSTDGSDDDGNPLYKDCNYFQSGIHPSRVYGDSDLQLAYLGSESDASARCLIWSEKKLFGRIYGDDIALRSALEAAGFVRGQFEGAKIRLIEWGDSIVLPYIDGINSLRRVGDGWLQITEKTSDIIGDSTCGFVSEREEDDTEVCESCEDRFETLCEVWISERNSQGWCRSCRSNDAIRCEGWGYVALDSTIEVDGENLPEWAAGDYYFCEYSGENTRESVVEVRSYRWGRIQVCEWRESLLNDVAFKCRITGDWWRGSDMVRDPWLGGDVDDLVALRSRFVLPNDVPEGFDGVVSYTCPETKTLEGVAA